MGTLLSHVISYNQKRIPQDHSKGKGKFRSTEVAIIWEQNMPFSFANRALPHFAHTKSSFSSVVRIRLLTAFSNFEATTLLAYAKLQVRPRGFRAPPCAQRARFPGTQICVVLRSIGEPELGDSVRAEGTFGQRYPEAGLSACTPTHLGVRTR